MVSTRDDAASMATGRRRTRRRTAPRSTDIKWRECWEGVKDRRDEKWEGWRGPTTLGAYLLLRWTKNERLYPSLTNTRSRFAVWQEQPLALTMGTRAPGAKNNNDGTGRAPRRMGGHDIPRRALLSFGRIFTREVAAKQSDFAGIISKSLGDDSKVRSGLTTSQVLARMMGRG